jgi:hypothetical protein
MLTIQVQIRAHKFHKRIGLSCVFKPKRREDVLVQNFGNNLHFLGVKNCGVVPDPEGFFCEWIEAADS